MQVYMQPVRDIFQTNAYFYINEENDHGCLIDPGAQPQLLMQIAQNHGWKIDAILLTHGHFDHTGAVDTLTKALNIPFYIHVRGPEYLQNDELNLASQHGRHIQIDQKPHLLHDGDCLKLRQSGIVFNILYTPGHSFDSVTYLDAKNQLAFVGDVLYNDGPGIWQFPGRNEQTLKAVIREKIETLPTATHCLVGHTAPMTIKQVQQIVAHF